MAAVPAWSAEGIGASNYVGGTCLDYNSRTLDSPGVFLEGMDYATPAIAGNYSVWVLGGSIYYPWTNRASIWQRGQIPEWARAVTFWTRFHGFDVTFNGKALFSTVISSNSDHTVIGAKISAYAGQTGELCFTGGGMLDNIEFSTLNIPEPANPNGGLKIELYTGLTITGIVSTIYSIQCITDLANSNSASAWQSLDFVQLTTSNHLWFAKSAPNHTQHFYRAVPFETPTNMIYIPPGTFRMGSPSDEPDRLYADGPQTSVVLSRGCFMGRFEVTQGEYVAIMGTNPSWFNGVRTNSQYVWPAGDHGVDLRRPVESISAWHAIKYCEELTRREREAGRIPANSVYRLPTEAEWEYACRADTSTRFSYGDDAGYSNLVDYAWCKLNSDSKPHPVGQNLPNAWGLYDMHGNVFECCSDWFRPALPGGIVVDPKGPAIGLPPSDTVLRGGSFLSDLKWLRSAARANGSHDIVSPFYGFRVVLAAD